MAALAGLSREAGVLHRAAARAGREVEVAVSGADAARAHWEAGHLARRRPDLLVSFGLAGGLDPRLAAGALILADAVLLPDGARMPADPAWTARLRAGLAGTVAGDVRAVDTPVLQAADKRTLAEATGAVAIDMESHALAKAAHDAGIPFVVVRALCDPSGRSVPPVFLHLHDDRGRLRWAVLRRVLARPGPAIGLWRDSRRAYAALARAAAALTGS